MAFGLKRALAGLVIFLSFATTHLHAASSPGWQGWSDDLFERAKAQDRFVILDLEALWCHWCHVMETETYGNPEVKRLLEKKYITVRVDQDAHPELSSRYGDWGWPATIIFAPDGSEIVKLRGYIPVPRMVALLQAVIDDPSPGPSVIDEPEVVPSSIPFLKPEARAHLLGNYEGVWDDDFAGWGQVHKFIHTDSLDYALSAALRGDEKAAKRAKRTLDAALNLIDPEWGGVYQYSDERDWRSPHYEKIMWYQAQYLRQYSLAHAVWKDPKYLKAARDIHRYLSKFMRADSGAFFTSQDADLNLQVDGHDFYSRSDKERRAMGLPRIDKNIYARDNGWAIAGLVAYANASGDKAALEQAKTAARWVLDNRSIGDGGFSHGENDPGGPYMSDTLAMGEALIALYAATGEREWLERADQAGRFIAQTFMHRVAGFITSKTSAARIGVFAEPVRQIEENIQLARLANSLHRYTALDEHREMAVYAMKYLTSDQITRMRRFLIGVVHADDELGKEPIHITVVGSKKDPAARALHAEAKRYPAVYKRVDWWDPGEGPMRNADIEYPALDKPAAFACGNRICSLPVFEASGLDQAIKRMKRAETRSVGN